MVNIDDNLHRKGFANKQAIKETRPKRRFRLEDDGFVSKGERRIIKEKTAQVKQNRLQLQNQAIMPFY
ncbi:MAG: hypothetical protein HXM89_01200 [Neisseria sp.]|uniref:hypothetical protein n=1 Tax=unclassified Neisseria TaxID=2623750 RepID=UPI0008A8F1DA|nr:MULTISPECIES: hypothetical protein [unclassified Neisseria]MBF1270014.1 hypothetical protein [Neisseria sp.]OHR10531.1 hypothetical protein HMPREF2596_04725 [Neisseria sp. HMSC078C12]